MDSHVVHLQHRQIEYRSRPCSCAYFTRCLLSLITVLLPIPIIFASQGLWRKFGEYMEQPRLEFSYRYLVLFESDAAVRYASTFYQLESLPSFLPSSISSQNLDHNGDGRADEITLTLTVPINVTAPSTISFFFLFDTQLDYHEIIETETVLHSRLHLATGHSLLLTSPLDVEQLAPLHPTLSLPRQAVADSDTDPTLMRSFPRDLMQSLSNHPLSLKLTRPIISPLYSSVTASLFTLQLSLTVPSSRLSYQTRFFELLKWAWIQYLAVAIIVHWACAAIASYLFEHRILHAVVYRID